MVELQEFRMISIQQENEDDIVSYQIELADRSIIFRLEEGIFTSSDGEILKKIVGDLWIITDKDEKVTPLTRVT